ncbi:MAG: CoA-transferase [Actinomycetota bacterium]|jgi:glutaconate CoA-transferase, subunit A|nr:CoA-transferase [Actinomycetota bacterium]
MSAPEREQHILDEVDAAHWVTDGMTIAIGDPSPMAMVRQLIRRGVRDLTVVGSGLALDLLVAAGCVRKTIAYYVGGGPSFRRAAEEGRIEVWECEEGILAAGLRAAAQGLPFLPWRGGVGTSLPDVNPDLRIIEDPIKGETLIAVPAIDVDVAILHAATSDPYGNVQHVGGPGWLDLFLHRAADRTIVQVEKIIPNEQVRANPAATTIAGADAVLRMPYGAHPFYSRGYYVQDKEFTKLYLQAAGAAAAGNDTDLAQFIETYCHGPLSHGAYLELIGVQRLISLYEY